MQSHELLGFQQQASQFAHARNWAQYHTPVNLLQALVGEVGELCEVCEPKAADD